MEQDHSGIERMLDELVEREGGFVDHPADRGGATRYGITEAVARAHGYRGAMRQLPRAEALNIYRRLSGCGRGSTRSPSARRGSPPNCSTPGSTWARRLPPPSSSAR